MAAFNQRPPPDLAAAHHHYRLPQPPSAGFGSGDLSMAPATSSRTLPAAATEEEEEHHRLRRHGDGQVSMAAPQFWSPLMMSPLLAAAASDMATQQSSAADFSAAAAAAGYGHGSLHNIAQDMLHQYDAANKSCSSNMAALISNSSAAPPSPYPAAAGGPCSSSAAAMMNPMHNNLMHAINPQLYPTDSLSALLISASDPASAAIAKFSLFGSSSSHSLHPQSTPLFPPSSASTNSSSTEASEQNSNASSLNLQQHHALHSQPAVAARSLHIQHAEAAATNPNPNPGHLAHHHQNGVMALPHQSVLLNKGAGAIVGDSPKSGINNGVVEAAAAAGGSKKKRNHQDCSSSQLQQNVKEDGKDIGSEEQKCKHPKHNDEDFKDMVKPLITNGAGANCGDSTQKPAKESAKPPEPPKPEYIHVRARRGQATDSHSLAERIRREKISERMKYLQDLVPGCSKVTGKAVMLDEIINYVQSLQRQVEFLSMKLAAVNPRMEFNMESLFGREIPIGPRMPQQLPVSNTYSSLNHLQQPLPVPVSCLSDTLVAMGRHSSPLSAAPVDAYRDSATQQQITQTWEDELQSLVQGRQTLLSPSSSQGQFQTKVEM